MAAVSAQFVLLQILSLKQKKVAANRGKTERRHACIMLQAVADSSGKFANVYQTTRCASIGVLVNRNCKHFFHISFDE
jgi:alpha/beta superfamily hydrolase